jgi:DNA-binding GntR family transcriptional regulator
LSKSPRTKGTSVALLKGAPPKKLQGEALGQYATRVIRSAIRSGQLAAGERLREGDVGLWLGISRTPVREAFQSIISDGLMIAGPRHVAMVAELDQNQLLELYFLREVLDGAASELAARLASDAEIDHLLEIAESELSAKDDLGRLAIINSEFHHAIYAAARNRYLTQSLNAVIDTLGLLRYSSSVLPGSIDQARSEHMDIIHAIRERDGKRADQAARKHVRNALALRLRLLRKDRQFLGQSDEGNGAEQRAEGFLLQNTWHLSN